MSIDEIANELNQLAYRLDSMRNYQATTEGLKTTKALREAAAMLQSNHNGKTNAPLTLDELREMDGKPVFIKSPGHLGYWALVEEASDGNIYFTASNGMGTPAKIALRYGGKIYRRKPEGGTK